MVTNNLGGISMDKCKKCNYSFTFYDRTKSFLDLEGLLRCPECRAIYKPKPNMYRAMILTFSMFDVLPHRWNKYRKIN